MKLLHFAAKVYISECSKVKKVSNSFALSNVYTSFPSGPYNTISKSPLIISDLDENFILLPASPENEISEVVVVCSV